MDPRQRSIRSASYARSGPLLRLRTRYASTDLAVRSMRRLVSEPTVADDQCVISGQPIGGNATLQAQETAPYLAVQDVEELSVDCRLDRNEQLLEYTVPEGMEWVIWVGRTLSYS